MKHPEDPDIAALKIFKKDAPISDAKAEAGSCVLKVFHAAVLDFNVSLQPADDSARDSSIGGVKLP